MRPLAVLVTLAFLVAGCQTTTERTFLSNGQPAVRVMCANTIGGVTNCLKTAGDLCGARGFVLFHWNGQPWARPYPGPEELQYDTDLVANGLLVACQA